MPETLNEFIEKKVADLEGLAVGAVGLRSWLRTALREVAEKTVEAVKPLDTPLSQYAITWLGTDPTQDGNHTL